MFTFYQWDTHLYHLHVLFTAANSHFGLQELIEALIGEITLPSFDLIFKTAMNRLIPRMQFSLNPSFEDKPSSSFKRY